MLAAWPVRIGGLGNSWKGVAPFALQVCWKALALMNDIAGLSVVWFLIQGLMWSRAGSGKGFLDSREDNFPKMAVGGLTGLTVSDFGNWTDKEVGRLGADFEQRIVPSVQSMAGLQWVSQPYPSTAG